MTGRPLNKHSKYVNCITFPYEMVNEEIITFHFFKREKPRSSWDSPKLIGNRSHPIPLVAVLERKWVLYLAHWALTCTVQFCGYIVGSTFIGFCSSACSARSAKTRAAEAGSLRACLRKLKGFPSLEENEWSCGSQPYFPGGFCLMSFSKDFADDKWTYNTPKSLNCHMNCSKWETMV